MAALLVGLLAHSVGEAVDAPVIELALLEEVGVDRRQLHRQRTLEVLERYFGPFHRDTPMIGDVVRSGCNVPKPLPFLRRSGEILRVPIWLVNFTGLAQPRSGRDRSRRYQPFAAQSDKFHL